MRACGVVVLIRQPMVWRWQCNDHLYRHARGTAWNLKARHRFLAKKALEQVAQQCRDVVVEVIDRQAAAESD